jgi:hypothetical protein
MGRQVIRPEKFVARAIGAGFRVDALDISGVFIDPEAEEAKLPDSQSRFITLTQEWVTRLNLKEGLREGGKLLDQVPTEGKGKTEWQKYERYSGDRMGKSIVGKKSGVDAEFLRQVGKLVPEYEAVHARKQALHQNFDFKVEEEINADPGVAELMDAIRADQAHQEGLWRELAQRREELRTEREANRGAFLYVADEREL